MSVYESIKVFSNFSSCYTFYTNNGHLSELTARYLKQKRLLSVQGAVYCVLAIQRKRILINVGSNSPRLAALITCGHRPPPVIGDAKSGGQLPTLQNFDTPVACCGVIHFKGTSSIHGVKYDALRSPAPIRQQGSTMTLNTNRATIWLPCWCFLR